MGGGGGKEDRSMKVGRRGYRKGSGEDNYSSQLTLGKLEALMMT